MKSDERNQHFSTKDGEVMTELMPDEDDDFERLLNHFSSFMNTLDDRIALAKEQLDDCISERNKYRTRIASLAHGGTVGRPVGRQPGRPRNLTDDVAKQIREADGNLSEIAARFGLSIQTINRYRAFPEYK